MNRAKNHFRCVLTEKSTFWRTIIIWLLPIVTLCADSSTTNQIGQGVVYRSYVYDSLYSSKQRVFIVDVNLNDPSPSLRIPYRTGGATRTVSQHAATVSNAIACVNAQFFNGSGAITHLRVNGTTISTTLSGAHDQQGVLDTGTGETNSISFLARPLGGWTTLTTSNILAAGPQLITEGIKRTNYSTTDNLVIARHPRTCVAWTYNNHLLLIVVDGRTSIAAGMTIPELRDYVASIASVRSAFNLDGGGSSTMWTKVNNIGSVKNAPSDGAERSVVNAIAIVAPQPARPVAPTNITASAFTNRVVLDWPVPAGAMNYTIWGGLLGGPYQIIGTVTAASFTHSNLIAGSTYQYRITAANSIGESDLSAPVTVAVPCPTLSIPTGLTGAVTNTNQVSLNWSPTYCATTYSIWRAPADQGVYQVIGTTSSTEYTDFNLMVGTSYRYLIAAANSLTQSEISTPITVFLPCPDLSAPTNLVAVTANQEIQLNWKEATGATGYIVNRATTNGGPYTNLASVNSTSYTDDLSPNTVYFYMVTATNSCGTMVNSGEISAPLSLLPPIKTGSGLTISGWGGKPDATFVLLAATNLATPLSNWTKLSTNVFNSNGFFTVTNSVDLSHPIQFFNIEIE